MKNKLIYAFLCIAVFLGTFNVTFAKATVFEQEFPSVEYGLLESLGILEEISDLNENVTRGEFAQKTARLIGLQNINFDNIPVENPFYDVEKGQSYFSEIRTLKDLNIISGDAFGNFYPNEVITKTDATVMILNALGYLMYAEADGGYPSGYNTMAVKLNLWSGISGDTVLLNKAAMIRLLYNTLFIKSINVDSITYEGAFSLGEGESVLKTYFGVTYIDATLVDDGFFTLTGTNVSEGKISIKDDNGYVYVINCKEYMASQYFGCKSRFFVKENPTTGEQEVLYVQCGKNFKTLVIKSDKVISVNQSYIEYEDTDGKYEKIYLSSATPYVMKNGKKITNWDISDLKSDSGIISFADYDGDNHYDYMEIVHFNYNIVTDISSAEKERLTCKVNPLNNLDLSSDANVTYRVWKDGKICTLDDISEYDIVSVAKADGQVDLKDRYLLYASSEKRTEVLTAFTDNYKVLITENGEYDVSEHLLNTSPLYYTKINYNQKFSFRIDYSGKIAYIEKTSSSAIHYCYLINLSAEHPINSPVIYYYDGEGGIKESTLTDNVEIDGEKLDGKLINGASADLYTELQELLCRREDGSVLIPDSAYHTKYNKSFSRILPKPAIIKVNSKNEILYIDTSYSLSGYQSEKDDSSKLCATADRVFRNKTFHTTVGTFDNQYFITSDTVILKVPDIDRYGMDDYSIVNTNYFETDLYSKSNYGLLSISDLRQDIGYDAQAYNIDVDTGVAGLLVIRGNMVPYYQSYKYSAEFAVFTKLTQFYDETTQENIYKLYYKVQDDEKSVLVDKSMLHPFYQNIIFGGQYPSSITSGFSGNEKTETVEYKQVEPLAEGDIISLESENGYLKHIQRDIDLSIINEKTVSSFRPAAPQNPYSNHVFSGSNIGFPFDQRYLAMDDSLENTYQSELLLPMNMFADTMFVGLPQKQSGSGMGCFGDYIDSNFEGSLYTKYIKTNQNMRITLIEELTYDPATRKSSVRVSKGDIKDIKTVTEYGKEEASRLYVYGTNANYTQMVIINLLPAHNTHR